MPRFAWIVACSVAGLVLNGSVPEASAASDDSRGLEAVYEVLRAKASEKSYDIRIAQEEYDRARAQNITAWTRWIPHLDVQLSQTRQLNYSVITSGALGALPAAFQFQPIPTSLSEWDLNLTLPLYRRAVLVGIQQASAEKGLRGEEAGLRRTELDWRLRSLLGDYLLQKYKEATLGNSLEIAQQNLKEARLRFSLGQKTRVDVLRSEANLVSLDSKRLAYQQQRDASLSALMEYSALSREELRASGLDGLLGSEAEILAAIDQFTKIDDVLARLEPYVGDPRGPLPEGHKERIDRQISEQSAVFHSYLSQEDLAYQQAKNLTSAEYPALDLKGYLSRQTPDWSRPFGSERSYSLAVVLTVPIFSGGSSFSTHSERVHADQASRLQSERDRLRFRDEVDNEITQIRSELLSSEAQKLNRDQNEEIVRLSFKSYQLGKATIVELLGSQDSLIDSKIALARTKLDLAALCRRLAWNLGVNSP